MQKSFFQRRTPLVPEDAFYVSQALGNAILGWGTGRYVIDAGTGAGKTTAIMKLLEKIMASCPEYELQDRKRILYLCNRKALREQIIQAIFWRWRSTGFSGLGPDLLGYHCLPEF